MELKAAALEQLYFIELEKGSINILIVFNTLLKKNFSNLDQSAENQTLFENQCFCGLNQILHNCV